MKFVTLFYCCELLHLKKDVMMIPETLNTEFGYDSEIVCLKSKDDEAVKKKSKIPIRLLDEFFNMDVISASAFPRMVYIKYLIFNSKKIDILNLYFLGSRSLVLSFIYKLINRKGIIYLKGDVNPDSLNNLSKSQFIIIKLLLNLITILSVESKAVLSTMKQKFPMFQNKMFLLKNGSSFDINLSNSKIEKNNTIITVGRIGAYQKNNEMLLEAIAKCDLKNWTVKFIGPIEENFKEYIKEYFLKYPLLIDKVIFTGAIYDDNKLFNEYASSKVFCLTSRFEGFVISGVEALMTGNFVLATDVGGVRDITDNFKYGEMIVNESSLVISIQNIIDGNTKVDLKLPLSHKEKFSYKVIIEELDFYLKKK